MKKKTEMNGPEPAPVTAEPTAEGAKAEMPTAVKRGKKALKKEAVGGMAPKKASRQSAKPRAGKAVKPSAQKVAEASVGKPAGSKTGPGKKAVRKPKTVAAAQVGRASGRKPGRKPAVRKAGAVPKVTGKKVRPAGPRLIGKERDLLKMGEGAFLYSLELTRRMEDLERELADYERVFEAVRRLFGREMAELEDLLTGLQE